MAVFLVDEVICLDLSVNERDHNITGLNFLDGTKSLREVVSTRCASVHHESSDDDVLARVQRAVPRETVLVDWKEHCVLCEQQFGDLAGPRSTRSSR